MPFIKDLKNALMYLLSGEWDEFEFRLKVYTGTIDLKNDPPNTSSTRRSHPYSGTSGQELKKVLDTLEITLGDAILDVGSGKGGAMITFAKYPFSKITGIEISPQLSLIARANFEKLSIERLNIIVGDAAEFNCIDDYNYFYLFNPFPQVVLRTVIQNIETSLIHSPRKIVIIYSNPQSHQVLTESRFFRKFAEFNLHYLDYYLYSNDKVP